MNKEELTKYRLDKIGFGSLELYQDPSDFCYGIDAVILSDFASETKGTTIFDFGCGNGIIPLILSHKTKDTIITGIEKRKHVAHLANINIKLNGLGNRINIISDDILKVNIKKETVDTVVTNPPYVAKGSGITKSPNGSKMTARHETTAGLNEFISKASSILKNKGEFYMVHRPQRTVEIILSLTKMNLEPKVIRYVIPQRGKEPNIMLIKAIKNGGSETKVREPLYVYNSDGTYTSEIMQIYERE